MLLIQTTHDHSQLATHIMLMEVYIITNMTAVIMYALFLYRQLKALLGVPLLETSLEARQKVT